LKKLILISENFNSYFGHSFEYFKAIKEEFESRNIPVEIVGNASIEKSIIDKLKVIPHFTYNQPRLSIGIFSNIRNVIKKRLIHFREFRALYLKHNAEGVYFFFDNVAWMNIYIILLATLRIGNKLNLMIMMRYSTQDLFDVTSWQKGVILIIYKASLLFIKKKEFILFTDSEPIANELESCYDVKVTILPMPHLNFDKYIIDMQDIHPLFTCFVPGNLTLPKGEDFVKNLFKFYDKNGLAKNIQFIIQKSNFDEQLYYNQFKNLNITIKQSLSTEEYYHYFNQSDLILVLYNLEFGYRFRTSGIMAEAISFNKPIISIQDSWMDSQLKKYDTGMSVRYNNTLEFDARLKTIITNYSDYKQKAIYAHKEWKKFNSKSNFFAIFTSTIS